MHRCVQRGLQTVLLTGGFLAVGAGVAAADENDLTADLVGVTATVPVADNAVVQAPVLTGHGGDTTVGSGAEGGIALPVNTNTAPGTTALGSDGTGGISVPVRVTEATDDPPAPEDGLTVTVPVNTSGGGTTGTTLTVPIVTGSLGHVLDGDPLTGTDIDVDLDGPLVLGADGSGLLVDLEDTVTTGNGDAETAPQKVLEVPVGLEDDRPTTVTLPLGERDTTAGPLSGNDVDVYLGRLIGDGEPPAADEPVADHPGFSLPIDTGDLLYDAAGGDAITGNAVDIHLGDLLGGDGSGTGSVIAVPVNENGSGTGSDNLLRITLPIDLAGDVPGSGDDGGTGDDDGSGEGADPGAGSGAGDSTGNSPSGGPRTGDCSLPSHGTGSSDGDGDGDGVGAVAGNGRGSDSGTDSGPAGSVDGDACGVGDAGALVTQASSTGQPAGAFAAMAGLFALSVGLLVALGRRRLRGDRS